MSDVSDSATVRLFIADYIAVDSSGKLNVIGGNITVLGLTPDTGLTAPFGIAVHLTVPVALYGAETALEVILEDEKGQPVGIPGPTGEPQLMRVAQNVTMDEPMLTGRGVPRKSMPATFQFNLMFAAGLPIPFGHCYTWRVKLDHATKDDWTVQFYVPGPPVGPVVG